MQLRVQLFLFCFRWLRRVFKVVENDLFLVFPAGWVLFPKLGLIPQEK